MYKLLTEIKQKSNAEIKIHVTENEFTFNNKVYYLNELKTRNDFRPFCNIVFPLTNFFKIGVKTDAGDYFKSQPANSFDSFTQSYNSKYKYLNHLHPALDMPVSVMFFPETKNFKEALLVVLKQDDFVPIEVTTTDNSGKIIPYIPDYEGPYLPYSVLPKCLLEVVDSDSSGTTLQFTYRDLNSVEQHVDFEATARTNKGYISHTKFDVKSGKGTFKFIPLGLSKGEKVTIDAGIGKYTRVASIDVVV
jgi:hypothetical protein